MSANPHANGGLLLKELEMPNFHDYAVKVKANGAVEGEATRVLGNFLADVLKLNGGRKIFVCSVPTKHRRTGSMHCGK